MKSLYEVLNVDLAQEYTKARKLAVLNSIDGLDDEVKSQSVTAIEAMTIPTDDERHHWIHKIANQAAADLLTLGKVQPENMLAMSSLPKEDFAEAVKIATNSARTWNELTISAEQELATDTIPDDMV